MRDSGARPSRLSSKAQLYGKLPTLRRVPQFRTVIQNNVVAFGRRVRPGSVSSTASLLFLYRPKACGKGCGTDSACMSRGQARWHSRLMLHLCLHSVHGDLWAGVLRHRLSQDGRRVSWPPRESLSSSFPAFSAPRASPKAVNGEILDFELLAVDLGQGQLVQFRAREVRHLAAFLANEMMMAADGAVESDRSSRVMKPPDQAQLSQFVKYAVHRGPRDTRHAIPRHIENLICGRMIVPFQDGAQHHSPLHRNGRTRHPAQAFELLQPLRDLMGFHVWCIIPFGKTCQVGPGGICRKTASAGTRCFRAVAL